MVVYSTSLVNGEPKPGESGSFRRLLHEVEQALPGRGVAVHREHRLDLEALAPDRVGDLPGVFGRTPAARLVEVARVENARAGEVGHHHPLSRLGAERVELDAA